MDIVMEAHAFDSLLVTQNKDMRMIIQYNSTEHA